MPKLSQYVHKGQSKQQQQPHLDAAVAAHLSHLRVDHPQSGPSQPPVTPAGPPRPGADDEPAALTRLREAYDKRLREHGPRTFRWPDGSLQPSAPPPSPYAVASRRTWAPLVHHCRTHGGDRGYAATGRSLRYGIGVSPAEHAAYLQQAELAPEGGGGGEAAWPPDAADPLRDPQHALNSFYKEAAGQVFKAPRGRLL